MNDTKDGGTLSALLVAIIICLLVASGVGFQIWHWPETMCPAEPIEPRVACYREWLMVLAAWLTFFGGGIAAVFVYMTIKKMNEQLSEARRQTAFMLGEEMPTIEILSTSRFQKPRFRVVNWNRRTFMVNQVSYVLDGVTLMIRHVFDGDYNAADGLANGVVLPALRIEGWENRSAAPPSRTFSLVTAQTPEWQFPRDFEESASAELVIQGQFIGLPDELFTFRTNEYLYDFMVPPGPRPDEHVPPDPTGHA